MPKDHARRSPGVLKPRDLVSALSNPIVLARLVADRSLQIVEDSDRPDTFHFAVAGAGRWSVCGRATNKSGRPMPPWALTTSASETFCRCREVEAASMPEQFDGVEACQRPECGCTWRLALAATCHAARPL